MINVKQLQIFRAVMQCGTVSAAARQLNVSQPAVTKMLHGLEETIGKSPSEPAQGETRALTAQVTDTAKEPVGSRTTR